MLELPADKFEGMRDRHDCFNAGCGLERLNFVSPSVITYRADNGAFGSADNMLLVAAFSNPINDMIDFLVGRVWFHIDNHLS